MEAPSAGTQPISKRGRPRKYHTEAERKHARVLASRKHQQKNIAAYNEYQRAYMRDYKRRLRQAVEITDI